MTKDLLWNLPDEYAELAIERFDPVYYAMHKDDNGEIESVGDLLSVAFDWHETKEGYDFWISVHTEYGMSGYSQN